MAHEWSHYFWMLSSAICLIPWRMIGREKMTPFRVKCGQRNWCTKSVENFWVQNAVRSTLHSVHWIGRGWNSSYFCAVVFYWPSSMARNFLHFVELWMYARHSISQFNVRSHNVILAIYRTDSFELIRCVSAYIWIKCMQSMISFAGAHIFALTIDLMNEWDEWKRSINQ